jgi:hypothetical protein
VTQNRVGRVAQVVKHLSSNPVPQKRRSEFIRIGKKNKIFKNVNEKSYICGRKETKDLPCYKLKTYCGSSLFSY